MRPLFGGYYELRTYYLASSITTAQKRAFDDYMVSVRHINIGGGGGRGGGIRGHCSPSIVPWCWLPGFYKFQGQECVAMRFMIYWKTPKAEDHFRRGSESGYGTNISYPAERLDAAVQAAGLVGVESQHCNFHNGPFEGMWRNYDSISYVRRVDRQTCPSEAA